MLMWSLLIGHILGDWFFQTQKQAEFKTKDIRYLILHSFIYASFTTIMFSTHVFNFGNVLVFLIFLISHFLIDNRKPVIWWIKNINLNKKIKFWFLIVVDQCFHIIILYIIARIYS